MINKLKRKFLVIGTVFMFILMTILVTTMNTVNYLNVCSEADAVLNVLAKPFFPFDGDKKPTFDPKDMDGFIPRDMSPEVPYESRFFSVRISSNGKVEQSDLSRIVSVDEDSADYYINKAMDSNNDRGFIGQFRYYKTTDDNGTRIIFLDCGRKLASFMSFLWISIFVGLAGCVVVFIAFILTAGKIVAPIAESYEKQKRFISDAGHEIKTPLTIINANVDLLELDEEKEELTEIRQQTKRLTELTNNLVLLSKMEESGHTLQKIDFPLSDLVNETAASFRAPAAANEIKLDINVESGITINGAPDSIRQLVSLLLDNAVKYAPSDSTITLELAVQRKAAVLSVLNKTKDKIKSDDLLRIFDRFYRTDTSRNSETGGHGIGLSIAKAITEAHGGTISASTKTGTDFCITVKLRCVTALDDSAAAPLRPLTS